MSETDKAKLDAAEPIGVTAAIAHLQEKNAPTPKLNVAVFDGSAQTISDRIIQGFLCNKRDVEAERMADASPRLLDASKTGLYWLKQTPVMWAEPIDELRAAIAQAEGK